MITREDLEGLFLELGQLAIADDRLVELAVYGGAALILVFPARPATRDVDAVVLEDATWIRNAVARIKEARGDDLDDDWLNDGVKGFLSARDRAEDAKTLFRSYPSEDEVGLRVFVATPEYLLAMKCMAMRLGGIEGRHDKGDIIALIRHLKLNSADQALGIVAKYYPRAQIPPKTLYGVEEIFEEMQAMSDTIDQAATPWQP